MSTHQSNEIEGWSTIKPKSKLANGQATKTRVEEDFQNQISKQQVLAPNKQIKKADKIEDQQQGKINCKNRQESPSELEYEEKQIFDQGSYQSYYKQKEQKTSEKILSSKQSQESQPQTAFTSFGVGNDKFSLFRMRLNQQTKRYYYFDEQFFKIYNCQQINSLESSEILKLKDEQSEIFIRLRNVILSYLNNNGGIVFFGFSSIMKKNQPHMEVNGFEISQNDQSKYDAILNAIEIIERKIIPQSFKIQVSIMKVRKDNKNKNKPGLNNKYVSRIVVQQGSELSSLYVYKDTPTSIEISARYSIQDKSFYSIKGNKLSQALEQKKLLIQVPEFEVACIDDFLDPQSSYRYQKSVSPHLNNYDDEDSYSYESNDEKSYSPQAVEEVLYPINKETNTISNKLINIKTQAQSILVPQNQQNLKKEESKNSNSSGSSLQSEQSAQQLLRSENKLKVNKIDSKQDIDPWNVELPKDNVINKVEKPIELQQSTEDFPVLTKISSVSANGGVAGLNSSLNNNTSPDTSALNLKPSLSTSSAQPITSKQRENDFALKNNQQKQSQDDLKSAALKLNSQQSQQFAINLLQSQMLNDQIQDYLMSEFSIPQLQETEQKQQETIDGLTKSILSNFNYSQFQQNASAQNYGQSLPYLSNNNNQYSQQNRMSPLPPSLEQFQQLVTSQNNSYNSSNECLDNQIQLQWLQQQQYQFNQQQIQLQQQQQQYQSNNYFLNNQPNLFSSKSNESHIAKILPNISDNQLGDLLGVIDEQLKNYKQYLFLAQQEELKRKTINSQMQDTTSGSFNNMNLNSMYLNNQHK